ncbi:hypothetical protein HW272_08445 [Peptostreptococcaceae bacterium oral taxon 081]|uniref:hypothetical protein n=1 Tax=Peptoanaerobacter stomatis TaxID=796937 RepID=UPI000550C376|nr:hypothetical protein [Peptoanaerobacter stomatis]NWO25691.1 hypothetical protein [Peptostreptococcaceae bacterium oral taxon 081]
MSKELIRNRGSNIALSLHDSRIINIEYQEALLRLTLDKIFQYTEEREIIYTGEIDFTEIDIDDCNILIFDKTVYEGAFSGKAISLTEYVEQYSNAEFEILTEGYNGYCTIYSGWIWQEGKEPVSGIIHIYNIGEIIYRIDS